MPFSSCIIPFGSFQSEATFNPDIVLSLIIQLFCPFGLTFLYCEFGERVSVAFEESCDLICDFQWYSFPIRIQQVLPTIMIGAQSPVDFRGFANFSCCRSRFTNVSVACNWCCKLQLHMNGLNWIRGDIKVKGLITKNESDSCLLSCFLTFITSGV